MEAGGRGGWACGEPWSGPPGCGSRSSPKEPARSSLWISRAPQSGGPRRSPSLLHRGKVWTLKGLPSVPALGTGRHRDEWEPVGKAAWPPLPLPSHQLAMDVSVLSHESEFWPQESSGRAHTALWGAGGCGAAGNLGRGHRGRAFTPAASPQHWETQAQRQLSEEVAEASLEFTFPAPQQARSGTGLFSPLRTHALSRCYLPDVARLRHVSTSALGPRQGLPDLLEFHLKLPHQLKRLSRKGYLSNFLIEKCTGGLRLGQSWPQGSPRLPTVRPCCPPGDFLLRPAFSHHLAMVCIVQKDRKRLFNWLKRMFTVISCCGMLHLEAR